MARRLSRAELTKSIHFAAFGAEEYLLIGSRHYAQLLEETGRTNWEHAIEWTERLLELNPDAPTVDWALIPLCYDELAIESDAEGRSKDVAAYRAQAIEWNKTILEKYPQYYPSEERNAEHAAKLEAHELEGEAAAAEREGDFGRHLRLLDGALELWLGLLGGGTSDREVLRHLKLIAVRYEDVSRNGERYGLTAEVAAAYGRKAGSIWEQVAEEGEDTEAWERLEDYSDWKAEEGLSAVITRDQAVQSDFNLSPSRYVIVDSEEEVLPLEEAVVLLREAEEERAEADRRLNAVLKELGLDPISDGGSESA